MREWFATDRLENQQIPQITPITKNKGSMQKAEGNKILFQRLGKRHGKKSATHNRGVLCLLPTSLCFLFCIICVLCGYDWSGASPPRLAPLAGLVETLQDMTSLVIHSNTAIK